MRVFICILFFIFSQSIFAAGCMTVGNNTDSAKFPDVTVQRDTPVGTVIQTVHTTGEPAWASGCSNETLYYELIYSNKLSSYGQHVYETAVPGIGIRVLNNDNTSMSFDSPASQYSYGENVIGWNGAKYELVVTGKVSSGVLPSGELATMAVNDTNGNVKVGYTMSLVSSNVTALSCSITSGGGLTFPFGNVLASQFTSIGKTSDENITAGIKMDCDANANINLTLSGVKNPDSSDDSILSLSNQGQIGVAAGIGVQLLYNGTPIKLNKMLYLKQSAGGQETFPITARYIQTKEKVKAGSANATATLDITYQ